ncbi:SCAN domain-containing protein 2 [uncultured Desulfovibrio sp.]|uniref:SCAN domain-containing protein 2 n=1 Tax=uncultured Desulfovibrio sp. TaxID=167968 RepID=UPI0026035064|nr:SCAN domain-containing protein 2 [uncultured Desulfovibrio sp.]
MNTQDTETCSLWRPSSFKAFQEVRRRGACFKLGCQMRLAGAATDVAFTGRIVDVAGGVAQFKIDKCEPLPGKNKPVAPACEFFFSLTRDTSSGAVEKMGYSGRGTILETHMDKDGAPRKMVLRISRKYLARRLRKDRRVNWKPEHTNLLGLLVVSDLPASRQTLSAEIKAYYKTHADARPTLINISAGGACLCVKGELAHKALMAHELYFFFFSPSFAGQGEPPHVCMGKKVGTYRDHEQGLALRMRFLYELDWDRSQSDLHWTDIEISGSERLRRMIRDMPGADQEQAASFEI